MPDKESLRKISLKARAVLTVVERGEKSKKLSTLLFSMEQIKRAETIAFYISCKDEVETAEMIERAVRMGKRVCAPVSKACERRLDMVCIAGLDGETQEGAYGILEPIETKGRLVKADEIDVVILPALAFDRTGSRLGYGCGYYDRFLKGIKEGAVSIGLAFEAQIVAEVPFESHDVKADYIVTEAEIIGPFKARP
ncbi:MAG: 5-formyltetrahydrofolate cyclo-ligase [Actinomycetota bacterium]|nr:5-formyltetrahydrofolate cyclo-ligase [Actinomycetota bacterium]